MSDPLPYPYHLGMEFPVMPVPPTPEHCIDVAAGGVTLVVEARDLADERGRQASRSEAPADDSSTFDDFGASLHVMGPDGAEYVRFDCFDKEPHYHYIRPSEGTNIIVRLDDVAEGDPIEWTVGRLQHRLPEMLEHAGAADVAASVRSELPALVNATETVRGLLQEAHRRAVARRASGSTLAPSAPG
jgi:hypothetical protein